jgi:hypothetical protein
MQYKVEIGDTYNHNETRIRIGIRKKEKVITISTAGLYITTGKDINRESIIIGEIILGNRYFILLIVILSGIIIQQY